MKDEEKDTETRDTDAGKNGVVRDIPCRSVPVSSSSFILSPSSFRLHPLNQAPAPLRSTRACSSENHRLKSVLLAREQRPHVRQQLVRADRAVTVFFHQPIHDVVDLAQLIGIRRLRGRGDLYDILQV